MDRGCQRTMVACWLAVFTPAACADSAPDRLEESAQDHPPTTFVTAPLVSIGAESGELPYLLSGVTDALRLAHGGVVIADCQSSELRFYDAQGRHLRTVGGEGSGPGEFSWIKRLFPAGGDSVGVLDPFQLRITIVAPDGGGVRTVRLPERLEVKGRLADGSFVVDEQESTPDAFGPDTIDHSILRMVEDGTIVESISGLPGRDVVVAPVFEGGPIQGHWLRLGHAPVIAVAPEAIFFGRQDEGGILEFTGQLEPRRTIHTLTTSRAVTEEDEREWASMKESGELTAQGAVASPIYSEEYSPRMPAYGDILAGRDGRLWVQDPYRMRHYPLTWTAYEAGRPVIRAELPPRFFPFEFGGDWVLGITYDELRVERVVVLELVPGELHGRAMTPREAKAPVDMPRCGPWASR